MNFKVLLFFILIGSWLVDPSYLQIQEGAPIQDTIRRYALQVSPTCPSLHQDPHLISTMGVPLVPLGTLVTTTISLAVAPFYLPEVPTLHQMVWT